MTRTLIRIAVSQADIDNGVAGSTSGGPVALAAERAMPGATVKTGCEAGVLAIVITRADGSRLGAIAREQVRDFAMDFDSDGRRHLCRPFEFDLELTRHEPPARPAAGAAAVVVAALMLTALGAGDVAAQQIEEAAAGPAAEELTDDERARRGAALEAAAFEMVGVTAAERAALARADEAAEAEPSRGKVLKEPAADCAVRGAIRAAEALAWWGSARHAAAAATWECQSAVGSLLGGLLGR